MYPSKEDTVELLIAAARSAVEQELNHPEDIAVAMINAIECSWPVVLEAHKRFKSAPEVESNLAK